MGHFDENLISLDEILKLSKIQGYALECLKRECVDILDTGSNPYPELDLENATIGDVYERFDQYKQEIEYNAMPILLAGIEAVVRLDYQHKRRKAGRFRSLYSTEGSRARLEDIIEAWKMFLPHERELFGKYKDALSLRNWLAHGRYFPQDLGRHEYSIEYLFDIGQRVKRILDNS